MNDRNNLESFSEERMDTQNVLVIANPGTGLISRIEKSEDLLVKPPGERSETDLNRVKRTFTPKQLDVLKEDYTIHKGKRASQSHPFPDLKG